MEQYKTELEMAVSAAIEPGTSAMELASDIKRYLNEPDMMFRRFRYKDEEGKWQRKWKQKVTDADGKVHFIDADPKEYHPGRGVYRSSARNAQRLARTEINMAYRTAEQQRWKSFDFVVGYEVKVTQNGRHVEDICDCLKGKYRKDFKFMGWHPQCLCYTIPILKTEDEFFDDDEDAKSVNEVEDVPQGFKDWVADNKERIEAAEKRGTLPYFIRDNREAVDSVLKPETVGAVRTKPEPKVKAEDDAIASALGIKRGNPMTFEEANEMWLQSHKTNKWEHTYISEHGGVVVTELERLTESIASKNEEAKFKKELNMCKVLADNGKKVEYLRGVERPLGQTYDITVDGMKADLKCITGGAGNIVKYASKALTKQGGEAVVFELPSHEAIFYEKITEARRKLKGKIFFYFKDEKVLREI